MDISGLDRPDPFKTYDNDVLQYIHLRYQQRNGRKCITIIEGLGDLIDHNKLLKTFKKKFCCNGNINKDKQLGNILQLSGDHRKDIKLYLINHHNIISEHIFIHGI